MRPLLIIAGATGTGKSDLAVACAKIMNGEVISADSMQIYRGLNIGTAKITKEEMQGVLHHLIDVADPTDTFTAADYKKLAVEAMQDILSRGKLPIFCGGTGLYISSVIYDLSFSGNYDPGLREALLREKEEKGKNYMHQKLASLDQEAAARLHVNDEKRVIRAIEKALTGGKKEQDLTSPKYPYKMFLTDMPRDVLYDRIEKRVDKMMEKGLKKEVYDLLPKIGFDKQCMQAIAYKEWALEGEIGESKVVALIKKNTRNYAKRQITWFKQYPDAVKVPMIGHKVEELAESIKKTFEEQK